MGIPSSPESLMERASSVTPPPLVRRIKGILREMRRFSASLASGSTRCPCFSTPSYARASAGSPDRGGTRCQTRTLAGREKRLRCQLSDREGSRTAQGAPQRPNSPREHRRTRTADRSLARAMAPVSPAPEPRPTYRSLSSLNVNVEPGRGGPASAGSSGRKLSISLVSPSESGRASPVNSRRPSASQYGNPKSPYLGYRGASDGTSDAWVSICLAVLPLLCVAAQNGPD